MDARNTPFEAVKRRTILRLASVAGGLSAAPVGVSAAGGENQRNRTEHPEKTVLGDFETGTDGWSTNGGNTLARVTPEDFPAGVTSGEHGLAVEVNGDAYPMVENKRRIRDADFLNYPYLRMNVLAVTEGTDSDLVFTFRLHHTATNGGGRKSGESSRSKDVLVKESEPIPVRQLRPQTVQWDMTELSAEVLQTAKRLEIVWYLANHEPEGGHRGRTNGEFGYRGLVVFDDIRLASSLPVTQPEQITRKKMELHRSHGMITDRIIEQHTETLGRGTLVFADGYETSYRFEALAGGGYRHTIDGETFEVGGDGDE